MTERKEIPREEGLENGLKVLREGYNYVLNRRQVYQSPIFETRLLGQKTYCIGGEEAAELFYDEERVQRAGAAPGFVQKTLLGEGGVQSLDDKEHRHRKQTFMEVMAPHRRAVWKELVEKHLKEAIEEWIQQDEVVLYEESQKVLARAVFEFADVPVRKEEFEERVQQLVSLFESPAAVSPKHLEGRMNRKKLEDWVSALVEEVRNEKLFPGRDSALYKFSWHKI